MKKIFYNILEAALSQAEKELGYRPQIVSGDRSPEHQQQLLDRWNNGDRQGLRVKPASPLNSMHCRGQAVDYDDKRMSDIDKNVFLQICRNFDLVVGIDFVTPDPVHIQLTETADHQYDNSEDTEYGFGTYQGDLSTVSEKKNIQS